MSFLGPLSYKFSHVLTRLRYRTAFYSLSKLGTLSLLKDRVPLEQKSGIHKMSFGACNSVYVGQTGQTLEDRCDEHWQALEEGSSKKSAFARHCVLHHHDFDDASVSLLHTASKGRLMSRLEEVRIVRAMNNPNEKVLNDISLNVFFNSFISVMFSPDHPGDSD